MYYLFLHSYLEPVQIFSPDEAKTAGNTLCFNRGNFRFPWIYGKIWRKDMPAAKGSLPDVRGEIRQQALTSDTLLEFLVEQFFEFLCGNRT